MFVRFEDYFQVEKGHLILNIDNIVSVLPDLVLMSNGETYELTKDQYEQLCRILTKRL